MAAVHIFPATNHKGSLVSAFVALVFSSYVCQSSLFVGADDDSRLPKLLLISFDGFGWNFLGKIPQSSIPNIQSFIERGVHVRWVENVFPTKTLPNHMSIVSGLYPESHGIVDDKFYDDVLKSSMPLPTDPDYGSKWIDMGAEPIWVTNSKAGEGRRSGSVYWPCSDAKIKGRIPDELKKGEQTVNETIVTPYQRIDYALDWLTGKSTKPVNFAAVYMFRVNEVSHIYGPDSPQLQNMIISRDKLVGHLLSEIKKRKLEDKLNVIITSGHGQLPIYPQQVIKIDLLIHPAWYTAYPDITSQGEQVMVNLWPKEGYHTKVLQALNGTLNLHVAVKGDRDLVAMHYSANPRIAPIVLYTEPGWLIGRNDTPFHGGKGEHGWDPRYTPNMYPFFIAMGPSFKKGIQNAEPFHIVDIYPLMCHILGLDPAPNNGSLSRVTHILSASPVKSSSSSTNYTGVAIGILILIIAVVIIIVAIRYVRKNKNVTASFRRSFARAGSKEELIEDGAVILSDEEL